jgi:hypothetical protein
VGVGDVLAEDFQIDLSHQHGFVFAPRIDWRQAKGLLNQRVKLAQHAPRFAPHSYARYPTRVVAGVLSRLDIDLAHV